jgi:GGDEF domain-containing protein
MTDFNIEPATIATMASLCCAMLTVSLALTVRQAPHVPGGSYWIGGGAALSLGFLASALYAAAPNAPPLHIANGVFFLLAIGLAWLGARRFRGAGDGWAWLGGAMAFYVLVAGWFAYGQPQPGLRMLIFSALMVALCVLAIIELLGAVRSVTLPARRVAAVALAALALMECARIGKVLFVTVPPSTVAPGTFNALSYLVGAVVASAILIALQVVVVGSLMDQVRRNAREDYLTGARNRQSFMADAPAWIASLNGQRAFAVRIDINDLKRINEIAGHDQGDALLRIAAQCARALLPPQALFARWGGDEFMAFIPGIAAAQRFEVELPRAFALAAGRLAAFDDPAAIKAGLKPGLRLRSVEYQGSLSAALGTTGTATRP